MNNYDEQLAKLEEQAKQIRRKKNSIKREKAKKLAHENAVLAINRNAKVYDAVHFIFANSNITDAQIMAMDAKSDLRELIVNYIRQHDTNN